MNINYNDLVHFTESMLCQVGLDAYSRNAVTTGLCESSLRGVDSHGIRLLPHYINSAVTGRKNPKPNMQFHESFVSAGMLDADHAFGHAAGFKAIDIAMGIAAKTGISAISVTRSSHPGAMASFVLRAARKNFIAMAFTQADSLILSHGGKRPYFGTNPIAMAAPRKDMEPFCLDMAPTLFSWNKLKSYREQGRELPNHVAVNDLAVPITNPDDASCLVGIGEHKGYALAAMVEVLCGALSGMTIGRGIPSMFQSDMDQPRKLAQFYIVMRSDIAIDSEAFLERMKHMAHEMLQEPTNNGSKLLLPGDKEAKTAKLRTKNGIPLDNNTYEQLIKLSEDFRVPLAVQAMKNTA